MLCDLITEVLQLATGPGAETHPHQHFGTSHRFTINAPTYYDYYWCYSYGCLAHYERLDFNIYNMNTIDPLQKWANAIRQKIHRMLSRTISNSLLQHLYIVCTCLIRPFQVKEKKDCSGPLTVIYKRQMLWEIYTPCNQIPVSKSQNKHLQTEINQSSSPALVFTSLSKILTNNEWGHAEINYFFIFSFSPSLAKQIITDGQ